MRFLKQKNIFSCGPIALMNIHKWLGHRCAYKTHYKKICKKVKCTTDSGGCSLDLFADCLYAMAKVLPRHTAGECTAYRVKHRQGLIGRISHALENGHVVVADYLFDEISPQGDKYSHIYIIIDQTEKSFYCLNYHLGHRWVSKNKLQADWFWIVSKK
jgi:hypothetical protein